MAPKIRPVGICGLCRNCGPLAESHAIPKALYRLCRPPGANQHPLVITEKFKVQGPFEMKDYFLCDACEDKFNRRGEDWIMKQCYRGRGRFWLRDKLMPENAIMAHEGSSVYSGAAIEGVDVAALTYFPLSVFWRTAARSWKLRGQEMPALRLGLYEDALRLYLLDQSPFPENVALTVWVSTADVPLFATHFPISERTETSIVHRFYIPGIQFMLSLGKQLDDSIRRCCIATGVGNPIFTSDKTEAVPRDRFRKWLLQHEPAGT